MEAIASENLAGAMLPQDAKKKYVVGSSKESPLAEEVKVEDQQKKAAVVVPPQDDNDTENRLAVFFHLFAFHKDKVLFLRRILGDALPVAIDTETEAPRDDSLR